MQSTLTQSSLIMV